MVNLSLSGEFAFFLREQDVSVLFHYILLQIFFLLRVFGLVGVNLSGLLVYFYDNLRLLRQVLV